MAIKIISGWCKGILYLTFLIVIPTLVSCSKSDKNDTDDAPSVATSDPHTDNTGLTLSKGVQQEEGIQAALLKKEKVYRQLREPGVVLSPHDLTTMRIRYQQESALMKKQKAQLFVSQKEYDRISKLYKNQQTSQKIFEAERAQWIADQSDYEEARLSLRAMTDSIRQEWGAVITKWVTNGSPKLDKVINQDSWLVLITPSENVSANFNPPAKITIKVSKLRQSAARYISKSPKIDQRIQKRGYFYLTEGNSNELAPDMNVIARIPTRESYSGVFIPDSSVVWAQGLPWIYVQTGPEKFMRKSISTAYSFGNGWVAKKNITKNDHVVVSGAQYLLSQEMLSKMPVQQGDGDDD